MNTLKVTGKFLDQPLLINKFQKTIPHILIGAGSLYSIKEIAQTPKKQRKKYAIQTLTTMGFTIASALAAPKITNKIFKTQENLPKTIKQIINENSKNIEDFIRKNSSNSNTQKLLNKAETNILTFNEVKTLHSVIGNTKSGQALLKKLIPDPENINSREIFSEIGRLSVFGLIPVIGGIIGGIIGDKLTMTNWKSKIPDKIKEGTYQYLANIFLCNIGAGVALAILERLNIKSKSARAIGMVGGILTTGVLGGSTIANFISAKIISPLLTPNKTTKNIYSERKPEALDISLHTDDIATVAVMSGLKWIEPALPLMYSISGFRAGIGYRNNNSSKH